MKRIVKAPRGGCTPCATERKTRERLASPAFPAEFPCLHPQSGPVPPVPARYTGDRHCPGCGMLVGVEVTVEDPQAIGYRCDRGHAWLAPSPPPDATRTETRRP